MVGNIRKRKKGKKRQRKRQKPSLLAMKNVLKQPEKNAQRGPGEKGWACYYCGKEGHLKRDCPRASKPPRLHVWSAKDHTGRETAPRGIGLGGWTLKTIRTEDARVSPHKLQS